MLKLSPKYFLYFDTPILQENSQSKHNAILLNLYIEPYTHIFGVKYALYACIKGCKVLCDIPFAQ